jgi:hypothetical protein
MVLYLMAILSKENSLTLLPLLFIYHAWIYLPGRLNWPRAKQILRSLAPHILMAVALSIIKLTQFSAIQQSEYMLSIGKGTIKTYLYFFLSFTNPPASSQAMWRRLFVFQGEFILAVAVASAIIVIALWALALRYKMKQKTIELVRPASLWYIGSMRLFVFGCCWWLLGFFVTSTMPEHVMQYYGLYPGLGLALVIGVAFFDILLSLARGAKTRILGYALAFIIAVFLIANYSVNVASYTKNDKFKAIYLSTEAGRVKDTLLKTLPNPKKGTHFIVLESQPEFRWVSSMGYQLKMIYDDMSIQVSFPQFEDDDVIRNRGEPDYYIRFTPDGAIDRKMPHDIEVGVYEK